jgi:hypothetical protein
MIIQENILALEAVLEKRGFIRASANVWAEPILGNFARIMEGEKIRVIHCSGYRFMDETIDTPEVFNTVLSALETKKFAPPYMEVTSVLGGMTDPKYFVCASSETDFVVIQSDQNWVEEAKEVGRMYTWRTATEGFEIKVRGKAQFKVAKTENFGYRKNENGHLFVIKLSGTAPKEYRINKDSMEVIEERSKPRKGAPPKLNIEAPKRTPKSAPEPKSKVVTTPRATAAKTDAVQAMEILQNTFGKGYTARQIKAELKELIELTTWPTTKAALFQAIVKKYALEIVEILQKKDNAKSISGKLSEADKKAFNEIIAFHKDAIRFTMRQEGIDFPPGFTDDPDFETKCVILLIDQLGGDRAVEKVKTKVLELENTKNDHLKRLNDNEQQRRYDDIFKRRGVTKKPSQRKIVWSPARIRPEYQVNNDSGDAIDENLSKALKIFMKELYDFAGQQVRPVLPGADKMFKKGLAVREMLQVDTAPSDVSDYSAEQFLEAFIERFSKAGHEIKIQQVDRPKPGQLNEEAEIIMTVKGVQKTKIKLHVRVNPKSLDSVFTKHNLMVHQASALTRLRLMKLKNVKLAGHNLTISVITDNSHPLAA